MADVARMELETMSYRIKSGLEERGQLNLQANDSSTALMRA